MTAHYALSSGNWTKIMKRAVGLADLPTLVRDTAFAAPETFGARPAEDRPDTTNKRTAGSDRAGQEKGKGSLLLVFPFQSATLLTVQDLFC